MKKNARKGPARRRKKIRFSDTARGALLAALIIAAAAFVSAIFIVIHSTVKDMAPRTDTGPISPAPEITPPEAAPLETTPRQTPETPPSAAPAPQAAARVESPPPRQAAPPAQKPAARQTRPAPVPSRPPERKPAAQLPAAQPAARPERPASVGAVVFVIDDAGNNLAELEPFLRYPGPLTIAVLPGLAHSAEAARRVRAAGKELFLHQPMEALGGQYPGPQAIYSTMDAREIREILARNVAEIGPVAGINNHQGSKITMDTAAMETVLEFCRERGICFLDSRTTADTVVPAAAQSLGIKIGERNTFIDNDQEKSAMRGSISSGLERARARGSAVMIGHAWSPDLAPLLSELYPNLVDTGYTFLGASAFIAGAKN